MAEQGITRNLYMITMRLVWLIGIVLCAFLLLLCLTTRVFIPLDYYENVVFQAQSGSVIFGVFASWMGILALNTILRRISEKKIFALFAALSLIFGCYIIFNVQVEPRADAQYVMEAAKRINLADYSDFDVGKYLFKYPHQIGLMTYNRIVANFSEDFRLWCVLNLLYVIIINIYLYKIAKIWFDEYKITHKYTIVMSFLFLPQFFFVLFLYGTIPGMVCVIPAIYWMSLFLKNKQWKYLLFAVPVFSMAVLLRNNYMIAIIAVIFVVLVDFLKKPQLKNIVAIGLLALLLFVPQKLINAYYEDKTGVEIEGGMPKLLWVAMGMQEGPRGPGWFNRYNEIMYYDTGYDGETSAAYAKQDIKKRLIYFAQEPKEAAEFYLDKIKSTWCEPTFQSVWSGPITDSETLVHTDMLRSIYEDGQLHRIIIQICNILVVDILLFAILYLWLSRKNMSIPSVFSVIFLIGGFLFHILWETKSQYVYMFIFCLIPLAAQGITRLQQEILKSRIAIAVKEKYNQM